MADFGGNYHQDRRLMHDTTASIRHSDQRSTSQDTAPATSHRTQGRGSEHSATEEATNEDDEEDSSTAQDDVAADEDEDPDVVAPFYGYGKGGKGKGKRPAIRVEPVGDAEFNGEDDNTQNHGAGRSASKHPVSQLLANNKKRTFSNLSSTSVLFGDDSTDQESFPRHKVARKLSNAVAKPLLTYQASDNESLVKGYENAIESDDEDYSGVNLIPEDDDSDMDIMERQEEKYILQEEQQATTLLNEYRDARRLSLESCGSDNIFDVNASLDDAFISSLPDFGFAQFFEPEALPSSPVPAVKRKFSDSSTKRVRFDDEVQVSDSSSSESSELDSSVFPDLFLDQDKLPPILHQLMEFDPDDDDGDMASPMSDGSFWDFGQEESRITQVDNSDDSNGESSAGSSGYDCMLEPNLIFIAVTNYIRQLIWVILLTKRILVLMLHHGPPFRSSPSCDGHHQHRAREQPPPTPFSEALARQVVRSLLLVACSSTMIAPRPLLSLTVPPRLSPSIVLALP